MKEPGGFYHNFLIASIGAVCLLILVGGIVRSTGSGMGCPDWPKCFGNWVPPTSVNALPVDYQETYSKIRQTKNLRLANYLETLGFNELVEKLRNDPSILIEEPFNPTKTWIEYLNRLLGVVIGLLILLNVFFSWRYRSFDALLWKLAVANLILVGFQGWVGSVVVSTNLLGGLITFHMLLALLILGVMIYNYWRVSQKEGASDTEDRIVAGKVYPWVVTSLILFIIQVAFGTQVRESIDLIARELGTVQRFLWIDQLGLTFYIHRSYSIILLALHLYFCYLGYNLFKRTHVIYLVNVLIAIMVFEILSGAIMAYFAIPAFFQPVHLILATLIFAIDYYLLLFLGNRKKLIPAPLT